MSFDSGSTKLCPLQTERKETRLCLRFQKSQVPFAPYHDLIDRPRIMPVMEHDARFVHLGIVERLNMPPRLLAHLTLVHDAETKVKIDNSAFLLINSVPCRII